MLEIVLVCCVVTLRGWDVETLRKVEIFILGAGGDVSENESRLSQFL